MAARPWRGTLLYVGAVAVMTAAGVAKFGGAAGVDAAAAAPDDSAASQSSDDVATGGAATGGAATGGSADGSSGDGSTASDGDSTDGSSDSAGDSGAAGSTSDGSRAASSDDVTIVGSVAQTRYGNVQVSVTFAGTKITDVQALQIPDREQRDVQISQQAIPILTQEAIESGSARIDTVSGATYTSEGYIESLQSAIDQRG